MFLGGRDGTYSITVESDEDEEAVGIEAKLQGVIQFRDPGVKANIDVKKDWDCMPTIGDKFSGLIMQVRPI